MSVEIGFGGVWVFCLFNLLFIFDCNGDDILDEEFIVMLEGFDDDVIWYNFVNGFCWGLDGWFYGWYGIMVIFWVGYFELSESERVEFNCGIWRFYLFDYCFEVVCYGMMNLFGMDWDCYGELFFINMVIGYFWYVILGVYFEWMYGVDFNLYFY